VLTDLLPGVLTSAATEPDAVEDQILDAALGQVAAYGLKRTTMDDVAKRAGLGRMTVYRRFASKDELLRRLVAREAHRVVATIGAAAATQRTGADRVVAAFVETLRLTRTHPLIDRLVNHEPEVLLELADLEDPDLLGLARAFVASALGRPSDDPASEVVVRLVISFVVLPRSVVDVTDEDAARAFARSILVPILGGK
jgi:AcrR family transcriptional regulator